MRFNNDIGCIQLDMIFLDNKTIVYIVLFSVFKVLSFCTIILCVTFIFNGRKQIMIFFWVDIMTKYPA